MPANPEQRVVSVPRTLAEDYVAWKAFIAREAADGWTLVETSVVSIHGYVDVLLQR